MENAVTGVTAVNNNNLKAYAEGKRIYYNMVSGEALIVEQLAEGVTFDQVRNALYQIVKRNNNEKYFKTKIENNKLKIWRLI